MRALADIAGKKIPRLMTTDFGFAIAPRLNAAGRLDDMKHGIECLLTDDPIAAQQYAATLDEMNKARRLIQDDMQNIALNDPRFAAWQQDDAELPWSVCLYDSSWHQGVIGVLAGKIKDRFH
ncbi:MAG TPA: single-stranded-DNA-specific exonuclease RecJ, partial [Myxococcota bacterium]|nr:single-stranded-DNA-specific exonuclease RecJ [Myxococcota bacterium]